MKRSELVRQSIDFATDIRALAKELRERHDYDTASQIGRSGSSVCANIHEAQFAESNADFIHKLSIALKEANETVCWIKLLRNSSDIDEDTYSRLSTNCNSLIRMLYSAVKTTRMKDGGYPGKLVDDKNKIYY